MNINVELRHRTYESINSDPRPLINKFVLAHYLEVSPSTIYKWVLRNVIPEEAYIMPSARLLLFRREAIITWCEKGNVNG